MNNENKKYYKYRSIFNPDGSENAFTASILQKGEIWYSAPKDFNDPFDCNLRLNVDDSTDKEWEIYIDRMAAQYPESRNGLEIAKEQKLWNTAENFRNVGHKTWEENYYLSSVFCLSKKPNSIPMFSYYADSHLGVAIEFEFSNQNVPCGIDYLSALKADPRASTGVVFMKVEYPEEFPELNYHRLYDKFENHELLKSIIFSKHHEWKHEDEYRIFRKGIPGSSAEFDKSIITKIIFGCRTDEGHVDKVREWLDCWPTDVILAKAAECKGRFDLDVVEFDLVKGV